MRSGESTKPDAVIRRAVIQHIVVQHAVILQPSAVAIQLQASFCDRDAPSPRRDPERMGFTPDRPVIGQSDQDSQQCPLEGVQKYGQRAFVTLEDESEYPQRCLF